MMKSKILLYVSRTFYILGALLLAIGLTLSAFITPAMAQSPEGSVLSFNSECSGDCSSVSVQVCNIGTQNMVETPIYNIWFAASGEPKFGSVIFSGNVPALLAGGCTTLTYVPQNSGNYQFQAFQPTGYSGQGDIWSNTCEVNCQIPTEVPTEIPTDIPTEVPTEVPTQVPTEQPTVEPLIIMINPACVDHTVEWTIQNMNYSDVEFYYGIDLPEPVVIPLAAVGQPITVSGNQSLVFTTSSDGPHRVSIFWYEGEVVQTLSSFIGSGFCPGIELTEEPTQSPPGTMIPPLEIPVTAADNPSQTQVLIPVTGVDAVHNNSTTKGYTENTIFNIGLICFGLGIICHGIYKKCQ